VTAQNRNSPAEHDLGGISEGSPFLDELIDGGALSGQEIRARLLRRLRSHGPECLSQLAIELGISNKSVLNALQTLEADGSVQRRGHRSLGRDLHCEYGFGEERWRAVH
jgi:biotin operon repressor